MVKLYNSEAQHGRFQAWKDHTPLRSSFHKTQLPWVLQSLRPTREGTTCYGKIKGLEVKLLSSSSTSSFNLRNYMVLARLVARICNPSTWGGWVGWITQSWEFKASVTNTEKPHPYSKYKISPAWWRIPVIPATREAEAGESLEPWRRRL